MRIKPKPPFNFNLTATHMHIMPPATCSNGTFSRILILESGNLIYVSISSNNSVDDPELFISLKPEVGEDGKREIKDKTSLMFSVDDDLKEFYSIAKNDSVLRHAIKDLYGLKVQTTPTLFEGLVIGFCLQWVSFQRGLQMIDCLIKKYGERFNGHYAFPIPEVLAEAGLEKLKECRLGFRAERIKWISEKVASGLNLEKFKVLPDNRLREELMKLKWIGKSTAEALLLWNFKRYNAFPIDVWSSKIFQAFYPELKDKKFEEIIKFVEDRWGKYKGLAYYYLICGRKSLAQKLNVELEMKYNS